MPDARPRGRQAEARRNDARVLDAALAVFGADPTAPMSAVAARAGVGQASLYRRYPSRDDLMAAVCAQVMGRMRERAAAAATAADPGAAVADVLTWLVESGALGISGLLGAFAPARELFDLAHAANTAMADLVARAVAAGAVRADVTGADLTLLATQIGALRGRDPERTAVLRRRYLALALAGLTRRDGDPLPGPAPDARELEAPWHVGAAQP